MSSMISMGPVYYQRLKQQVYDKLNFRAGGDRTEDDIPEPGGAYSPLTRQTVSGRANGGGLKIGEMERDSLVGHGMSAFIKESFIDGEYNLEHTYIKRPSRKNCKWCVFNQTEHCDSGVK